MSKERKAFESLLKAQEKSCINQHHDAVFLSQKKTVPAATPRSPRVTPSPQKTAGPPGPLLFSSDSTTKESKKRKLYLTLLISHIYCAANFNVFALTYNPFLGSSRVS